MPPTRDELYAAFPPGTMVKLRSRYISDRSAAIVVDDKDPGIIAEYKRTWGGSPTSLVVREESGQLNGYYPKALDNIEVVEALGNLFCAECETERVATDDYLCSKCRLDIELRDLL